MTLTQFSFPFDTITFTAGDLPTDGTNSLNHAFGDFTNTFFSATNSPNNFAGDTGTVTIVPEPGQLPMLVAGVALVAILARRRARA